MKNLAILLCLISSVVLVSTYQYDHSSCKTLLPVRSNTSDSVESATVITLSSEETLEDEKDGNEENDEAPGDLVPALERSPYKIETSNLKYRRNTIMTIRIEGSKLNGLLLQARQRFPSSLSTLPTFIGNFVDVPEGFQTMDCNAAKSPFPSNSVFNTNKRIKTSVKLNWKAPNADFDSIEFVATIIRGKYYWTHVKSMPIFFNEFPPSFSKCGKERTCHQYVRDAAQCEDGYCKDYVLMSEVSDNLINFYIGGRVEGETGFIGVAFTDDNEKLSVLHLSVCRKTNKRAVDVASYKVNKSVGHMVEQSDIVTLVSYDIEDDYIWCSFSRSLPRPDEAEDLPKELFYFLIKGGSDPLTNIPFLPNDEDMVKELRKWEPSKTLNTVATYGGSNVARLSLSLVVLIFMTNLLRLIYGNN